jgi:P27 family predicted phage terminase small subunit
MSRLKLKPPDPVTGGGRDDSKGGPGLDFSNEPAALDESGLAEWRRLAAEFESDPGRFREGDRAGLEAYCSYFSDFLAASYAIQSQGLTVPGRSSADAGRQVKNPAVAMKREASQQLRLWARELGLTPNARAQMKIREPQQPGNNENPFF